MTPRRTPTPDLTVQLVDMDDLTPDPDNTRRHSDANIDAIRASLHRFGQQRPLVVDRKNVIRAGNGTFEAMLAEGWTRCAVIVFPGTAAEARAFAIADNRTAELAHWDDDALLETLQSLPDELVHVAGFDDDDIAALLARITGDGLPPDEEQPDDEAQPGKGELLALAACTVGEPDFHTATGEVWQLGRHVLAVADVHDGWPLWAPLLDDGWLLWPYPSLLAPFTERAETQSVLMVQPNLYLAGWLLTKWARITGKQPQRVEQ